MTNKVNKQTNKGKRICTRNNKIYQYVKTFLLEAPYSRSLTINNHIYMYGFDFVNENISSFIMIQFCTTKTTSMA